MKKFFSVLLVIVIGTALTFGVAYAIDKSRMDAGKPVVFSTWGKDYTPKSKSKPANEPDSGAQNTEATQENNTLTNTSNGNTTEPQTEPVVTEPEKEVTLYFADMDLAYLCAEKRVVKTEGGLEKAVVEAIISGPVSDDYFGTVTSDVKVNSVSVDKTTKTCVVDLSKEFVLNNTGGASTETFAIYSIVNSLCELPDIDKVKINIDGNENAVFGGHYDISTAFEADMSQVSQ